MSNVDMLYMQMVLNPKYRMVTTYVREDRTMKLTRRAQHRKNSRSVSFVLTVGKPNYNDALIIKRALRENRTLGFTLVKCYEVKK